MKPLERRGPHDTAAVDLDEAGKWAVRNLEGPALAIALAPEAVEGLNAVFVPDGGEARRRFARDMPSDSELVARWLETEPGATRLVAEQGRGCLIALARLRISAALTQGERARRRGASWETAQRVAEQMVQGLD